MVARNRGKQTASLKKKNAEIEALMKKHDVGGNRKIDMDELREILTDLDKEKRPPLPKNLVWCMTIADKDKSGSVSKGELTIALGKYMAYIASADSMEELIAKHDKDGDSMLDNGELKALLQEVTGTEAIDIEDVYRVQKLIREYSKVDSDGMNPAAISKAISVWDDERNLSEGTFANSLQGGGCSFLPALPNTGLEQYWEQVSKTSWEMWDSSLKSVSSTTDSVATPAQGGSDAGSDTGVLGAVRSMFTCFSMNGCLTADELSQAEGHVPKASRTAKTEPPIKVPALTSDPHASKTKSHIPAK